MSYNLTDGVLDTICKKIFMPTALLAVIKAETKKTQTLVLNNIKQALEGRAHINCQNVDSDYNYGYARKQCLNLKMTIDSSNDYIDDVRFELNFNQAHQLVIEIGYRKKYFFTDANQIETLKNEIQKAAILAGKKCEIAEGEALKKAKIKDFKKKAIIAKALELLQLENVPYIIDDSFTTKIVIFIRLSETVRLEVNVPYSNYQIVLQNTQAAIQAMRQFADKGIAINVRTSAATTPFYNWQKPNS
jgi:hypothetical protein